MKKIWAYFCLGALLATAGTSAFAEDKSDGCGVGWKVTQSKSLLGTTTRGTTAGTLPPSFSMTSGTSGCAKHSIVKNEDMPAAAYAVTNYESLMIEMAQGQGEYLDGFASAFGCKGTAREAFAQLTQKNYRNLVKPELQPAAGIEMFKEVKHQIESNEALASQCGA